MATLLASGRDADVYAIGDGRVLRRYRDGSDATAEAAVMEYVRACGFPVPVVYRAEGADLVMERVDGPTLLHALLSGEIDTRNGAVVLADLHTALHALPPRDAVAGACVLHLDLHPDNVVLGPAGPVLIDWRNAADGPADLDIALSALILAQVAVDRTNDLGDGAGELMTSLLAEAGGEPERMLDRAVELRRADPNQSRLELEQLAEARALVADRIRRRPAPGF